MTEKPSLTEQLGTFLSATRADDIPDSVLEGARVYVLDWLGSSLGGTVTPAGQMFARWAAAQPEAGSTVFGFERGRSAGVAAMHNGATSHILEMDDVERFSVLHPGCVVIPAALALAEQRGASGRDFLASVALGYEVVVRVGEAVGKRHYYFWHNTATCGTFGAAAAAGWLLGLSANQHVWALGNAGTQSSGLWQFLPDGAMSKHLHAGHAASAGLLAAELAAEGFVGPRQILEGDRGFFAATAPDAIPDRVVEGLDVGMKDYKLSVVSFKPYPSCRHTHPAADAALSVQRQIDGAEIKSVEIRTYKAAIDLCDNAQPVHPYQAKFSLQYCVGRMLLQGRLTLADFEPERLPEARIRSLIDRTTVTLDPAMEARYPREWPTEVAVLLADGRRVAATVQNPKGDPENPLSQDEAEAKFRGMLERTPFEAAAGSLIQAVADLPRARTLTGLLPAILARQPARVG